MKKNSIKVVLVKIKGTYGYDNWNSLTEKAGAFSSQAAKDDPGAGIMDMMKQSAHFALRLAFPSFSLSLCSASAAFGVVVITVATRLQPSPQFN